MAAPNLLKWLLPLIFAAGTLTSGCKPQSSEGALRAFKNGRKIGLQNTFFAKKVSIDPLLQEHFEAFEALYGGTINDVAIGFGKTDTIASCRIKWDGTKYIRVNQWHWDRIGALPNGETKRRIIIFHELGHCVLEKIGHNDNRVILSFRSQSGNGSFISAPASIMSEKLSDTDLEAIYQHLDAYLRELFTGKPVNSSGKSLDLADKAP